MNASLFQRIRASARHVALALVMAFMLPILLSVLAVPALSAEAKLERALAQSLCTPAGEPSPAVQHVHEDCCILCATGLPPVGEGKLSEGLTFAPPWRAVTAVPQRADHAPLLRLAHFASTISLRGPPALI